MKTSVFQTFCLALMLTPAVPVHASTLLVDTGIGSTTETRATDFNPNFGNGILASIKVGNSPVTIDQFGLYGKQGADGNLHFSIFDGSSGVFAANGTATPNLTRVYDSGSVAKSADASLGWIYSPTFNLTLDANKTYYMGIISDQTFSFNSAIPAPTADLGLGLTALASNGTTRGINGNFANFADPTFTRTAWAQVSTQVYGSPVPLPAAFWLFGSALAGMGIVGRRRDKSIA